MSETCHLFLVPSRSSSTPLYPSIVLRAKERAPTPCPSVVFSLGFAFEPLKELRVRQSIILYENQTYKIFLRNQMQILEHVLYLLKNDACLFE
jgi:hypothetical protein